MTDQFQNDKAKVFATTTQKALFPPAKYAPPIESQKYQKNALSSHEEWTQNPTVHLHLAHA